MPETPLTIRAANSDDAAAIATLATELGYPAASEAMAGRLQRLGADPSQLVIVAVSHDRVMGWLHAMQSVALESGSRVEIVGLVVAQAARRMGAGRTLVARAEAWARTQGVGQLVVRSNTQRVESHAFYPALGFRAVKTQAVYRKALPPERPA